MQLSINHFNGLLPARAFYGRFLGIPVVSVSEMSPVVNILLHIAYKLPCDEFTPVLNQISDAIDAAVKYGLSPPHLTTRDSPIASTLHGLAASHALEIYILAASHGMYDVASSASQYLHSLNVPSLSDETLTKIGPVFLKRLCDLQLHRIEALKRLLPGPPSPHPPTVSCDYRGQSELSRIWTLFSAFIAWEARADLSASYIEQTVISNSSQLSCPACRKALRDRGKELVIQWNLVKVIVFRMTLCVAMSAKTHLQKTI